LIVATLVAATALGLASCVSNNDKKSTSSTPSSSVVDTTPSTVPSTTPSTPSTTPSTPSTTPSTPSTTPSTPSTAPSTPSTAPSTPSTPTPTDPVEVQKAKLYVHANPDNNYAAEVEPIEIELTEEFNGLHFAIPEIADPEDDYRTFAGWYTDESCTTAWSASDGIFEDTHIYAKWTETIIDATYRLYVDNELAAGKLADDFKSTIYTVKAGATVRARNKTVVQPDGSSVKYVNGIQNGTIEMDVPNDATVYIYGNNGSSSSASGLLITYEDGTTQEIGWAAGEGKDGGMLSFEAKKGKYVITKTGGTVDIFDINFTCKVGLSPISGIDVVAPGVTDLIEGQTYSTKDIASNIVYSNNTSASLNMNAENVSVDFSNVNVLVPGTYPVTVSYAVEEMIYGKSYSNTYTDTFNVTIYELQEIQLGFNATIGGKNSFNSIYINDTVQRVYLADTAYSANALTVTAITKDVNTNEEKEFILPAADYVNDNATSFVAEGVEKTITITYTTNDKTVTASYNVYVVTTAPSIVNGVAQVKVDGAYTGEIAAVVDGYNTFNTIQQAVDYLELQYAAEAIKGEILISLAAGTYNEKIEINLPNVTIQGAGKDVTKIEWDSLYGIADESGYVQVTDSTATLAVREDAENFTIKGVTVSNWYNSTANFQAAFGKGYGEHRALALIVQADKFVMDDCALLGYQDTVEFFTGRQLITNTLITGTTDFIFGTNNTTYFKNCEIRSIVTEDSYKAGGYITAFKGCNKGADDAVTYGAIFDQCNFTCDEGVYQKGAGIVDENGDPVIDEATGVQAIATDGKTAIGRPWGAYAAVAVINSELGAHISTTGFDGVNSRNLRYVSMSGNNPDLETVKFVEYNNTGVGAITEAVTGCRILDATEAANYSDLKVVFAATNGNNAYDDSWLGTAEKDAVITVVEGSNTVATYEAYVGVALTEKEVKNITNAIVVPNNYKLVGVYTDNTYTTELAAGYVPTAESTLYAKFEAKGALEEVTYTLDYTEFDAANDKDVITAFANSPFLTVVDSKYVTARTKNGACYAIENKDANLAVTFETGGTITITFASTGGSNESRLALVDENGDYVVATESAAALVA
ncbi:MAG: InlB B-repeat-containing protein, partial [Acholeplasmatales bacterium]|nr:InlB B-repeat-containing protein [Acholeplasmatales bacterium]